MKKNEIRGKSQCPLIDKNSDLLLGLGDPTRTGSYIAAGCETKASLKRSLMAGQ
jgi:hypothetical protein